MSSVRRRRLHKVLDALSTGGLSLMVEEPLSREQRHESRGTWQALADALDPYHAVNLLEALRIVPDTGDWHGSLRIACKMTLEEYEQQGHHAPPPNVPAERQVQQDGFGEVKA